MELKNVKKKFIIEQYRTEKKEWGITASFNTMTDLLRFYKLKTERELVYKTIMTHLYRYGKSNIQNPWNNQRARIRRILFTND